MLEIGRGMVVAYNQHSPYLGNNNVLLEVAYAL